MGELRWMDALIRRINKQRTFIVCLSQHSSDGMLLSRGNSLIDIVNTSN